MPELPEMETYRVLLAERVEGREVKDAEVNREKCVNMESARFKEQVIGKKIVTVQRRGKHLIFRLESGKLLLVHLMLGGWLYHGTEQDRPENLAQVVLAFGQHRLYFFGLRFGFVHLLTQREADERLANLGPEPLSDDFTARYFQRRMGEKRGILKNTLVDQRFIAGIGNRYADEICFAARQLPLKRCSGLTDQGIRALYAAIPKTLERGIAYGGYVSRPLYSGDMLTGGYAEHCNVYNREGEACPRCGRPIMKEKLSSRKVFFCPNCQG